MNNGTTNDYAVTTPPESMEMFICLMWLHDITTEVRGIKVHRRRVSRDQKLTDSMASPLRWLENNRRFLEPLPCKNISICTSFLELDVNFNSDLVLQNWTLNGCYVQVGFIPTKFNLPEIAQSKVALSMLIEDKLSSMSSNSDLIGIMPFFYPVGKDTFNLRGIPLHDMSNLYWCRVLFELRNKVQIAIRALHAGLDPEVEYGRFVAAGGKYFLDYPRLCP
jgi:hypothetical protein